MSEMIERVARAIDGAAYTTSFSDRAEKEKWLRAIAVAAIEAMREPTRDMVLSACKAAAREQVRPVAVCITDAETVWGAMIVAALKD